MRKYATVLTEFRKTPSSGFFPAKMVIAFVFCEIG